MLIDLFRPEDASGEPDGDGSLFARRSVQLVCWGLFALVVCLLAGLRLAEAWPAGDLTAYLAAADVYWEGGNPYGSELRRSEHYAGYPYVYPPATLVLLRPLVWLPAPIASGLATLASGGLLAWSTERLHRRFALPVPLAPLVLATLFFGPVTADLLAGNLAVAMLAANIAVAELLGEADALSPGRFAGLAALGLILSFKVMWLIPAAVLVVADGRWRAAAAFTAGAVAMFGGSLLVDPGLGPWLARLDWLRRAFPESFDLLSLAPRVYPVAVVAAGTLIWACRRRSTDLVWAAACCSVVAWPRLAPYSFLVLAPAIAQLAARFGPRVGAVLVVPMWGPVYWLFGMPSGMLQPRWWHLIWACAVAGAIAWTALRRES